MNLKAPNFSLQDNKGNLISLESLIGKKIVLYFYPKDESSGCSKEACSFRDNFKKFSDNNVVILGVSKNNKSRHNEFIEKFNLPFRLLVDEKGKVNKEYNKIGKRTFNLLSLFGLRRMTFLIDENGYIIEYYKKIKIKNHVNEILNKLKIS